MSDKEKLLLALLIAAIALIGGGVAVRQMTRGIRNNNPGNIRRTGTTWQGEVPASEADDPEFEQFVSPEYGIRAMRRILGSYAGRGVDTLREIITTWAPPSENPTDELIAKAAERTGLDPDTRVVLERDAPAIINALIYQENGINPYPAELIDQGIRLA